MITSLVPRAALFTGAAAILAAYVIALAVIVYAVIRTSDATFSDSFADLAARMGPFGVTLTVAFAIALMTSMICALGIRGMPRRTRRLASACVPSGDEGDRPTRILEAACIGVGARAPTLWIIEDDAPNALSFGRGRSSAIALTTGALRLPNDELQALCTCEVMMVASGSFANAAAAVDLLLLAHWCTTFLWSLAIVALFSVFLGVPIDVAGAIVGGTFLLVLATAPLLSAGDRLVPRLIDDTAALADLETARLTANPTGLAHLLVHLLEDRGRVSSPWSIAHLWFERDILQVLVDPDDSQLWNMLMPSASHIGTKRYAARSHRSLATRASVVVELADGDSTLRTRLDRATDAVEHA